MKVTRIVSAPFEVNVHVVEEDGRALVVDASSGLDWDSFGPRLAAALRGLAVEAVYLTHLHVDHVGGAAHVARLTALNASRDASASSAKAPAAAPLLMHADEAIAVERGDARMTGGALFGVEQEAWPVRPVKEGDEVTLGARRFEVLLVPGHSPAHTALWDAESRSLLSGDVVFAHGSFGRVDLPGADPRAMLRSLERLAALDAENLYPGHMEDVEGNAREAILESLDNARLMLG